MTNPARDEIKTMYETEMAMAMEAIERLTAGKESVPLHDVALLLPIHPEWNDWRLYPKRKYAKRAK